MPSSVALPASLGNVPLSVIGDGIIDAGTAKKWKMKEIEPGMIRGTLNVRGKHQAVVDVVFNNQQYAINYVSSRNLLSQGARIHKSYNKWVRELEAKINIRLDYIARGQTPGQTAPSQTRPAAATAAGVAFDPTGYWKVAATYSPAALSQARCPQERS